MAFVFSDRVRETATAPGTGDITLAGAFDAGHQAFGTPMANGDTTDICIFNTAAFEFCRATYVSSGNKLQRGTRYSSSTGAQINFTADVTVIMTLPAARALGCVGAIPAPSGRLTLQTGVPVMTTTQSAKTTIYYTPYVGNQIAIYDGTNMVPTAFSELSIATTDTTKNPAAIGASKVNDWFVWNDGGTIRLSHGPDWTSDTARSAGTALTLVNGVYLNNAGITNGPAASRGTYVGTTRSNSSSQLNYIFGAVGANGTAGDFAVWNMYNRVLVQAFVGDSTDNWTYSTNAIRPANNSTTMRVSYVVGIAEDGVTAEYGVYGSSATQVWTCGVGFNSTTAYTGAIWTNALGLALSGTGYGSNQPAIGYNYVQALENNNNGSAAVTFYGDNGGSLIQNQLIVSLRI